MRALLSRPLQLFSLQQPCLVFQRGDSVSFAIAWAGSCVCGHRSREAFREAHDPINACGKGHWHRQLETRWNYY
jgi:hypothetical protein